MISICLERSVGQVVSALGVLQAGGAYTFRSTLPIAIVVCVCVWIDGGGFCWLRSVGIAARLPAGGHEPRCPA